MFVKLTQTIGTPDDCFLAGKVYEVPALLGDHLIRTGCGLPSETPPEAIAELLGRLDVGAGQTVLYLPFIGEFGHLVMTHVRLVHFSKAARKIVCCQPGQQVLFPSADQFVTDWTDPTPDLLRIGTMRGRTVRWPSIESRFLDAVALPSGDLTPDQEMHCIAEGSPMPLSPKLRSFSPDVVLGVRRRDFIPQRNWRHWQAVADALTAAGFTFAVMGDRATSFDLAGQAYHTGDYDTDAAVESLQRCRLYIGTDSGGSHLAALVGCPQIVFRTAQANSRDLIPQMVKRNPGRVRSLDTAGWSDPGAVIAAALEHLAERDGGTGMRG